MFMDHFPGFPVLPGVFMIESLVQAGRVLLEGRPGMATTRLVLSGVRALKYGSFVRPGQTLRVEVTLHKALEDGSFECKGEGVVLVSAELGYASGSVPPTAVSGRFTLRPVRCE
jgi:3-hydroxyacyl-[acyl-carrier-protein] dehydratase